MGSSCLLIVGCRRGRGVAAKAVVRHGNAAQCPLVVDRVGLLDRIVLASVCEESRARMPWWWVRLSCSPRASGRRAEPAVPRADGSYWWAAAGRYRLARLRRCGRRLTAPKSSMPRRPHPASPLTPNTGWCSACCLTPPIGGTAWVGDFAIAANVTPADVLRDRNRSFTQPENSLYRCSLRRRMAWRCVSGWLSRLPVWTVRWIGCSCAPQRVALAWQEGLDRRALRRRRRPW
jgi:hypothetical protein